MEFCQASAPENLKIGVSGQPLNNIVEQLGDTLNGLHLDLAAAAALYQMLNSLDPLKRIEKFVGIYHKFNQKTEERHIYGVTRSQKPNDTKPLLFIESIIRSLQALRTNTVRSLTFFLDRDVDDFKDYLLRIARKISESEDCNYFNNFIRANVKLYHTSSEITINEHKWAFNEVRLLNYDTQEPIEFEPRYSTLINSSEHVYWREVNGLVHILAMPHSFSKIFHSIEKRYGSLKNDTSESSYPTTIDNTSSIKDLPNFQTAVQVISTHREMNLLDSETVILNWLQCLPESFHPPLVNLVAAHETMTTAEMNTFATAVREMYKDGKNNPFILKRPGDFGGTHRVLQRDQELGRTLKMMTPMSFQKDAETITLVCDNIISGVQTTMALEYYCGLITKKKRHIDEGYHDITQEENECFLKMGTGI